MERDIFCNWLLLGSFGFLGWFFSRKFCTNMVVILFYKNTRDTGKYKILASLLKDLAMNSAPVRVGTYTDCIIWLAGCVL